MRLTLFADNYYRTQILSAQWCHDEINKSGIIAAGCIGYSL